MIVSRFVNAIEISELVIDVKGLVDPDPPYKVSALFISPFSIYGVSDSHGRFLSEEELYPLVEEFVLDTDDRFCRKGDAGDRPLISRPMFSASGEFLGVVVRQKKEA